MQVKVTDFAAEFTAKLRNMKLRSYRQQRIDVCCRNMLPNMIDQINKLLNHHSIVQFFRYRSFTRLRKPSSEFRSFTLSERKLHQGNKYGRNSPTSLNEIQERRSGHGESVIRAILRRDSVSNNKGVEEKHGRETFPFVHQRPK